ncbi:MAG: TIGR03915 family putative DNA repair protein [Clostridia bacterium]|nr:TIGR03915 family putative DNA repair protein [Clostridia bacterium]
MAFDSVFEDKQIHYTYDGSFEGLLCVIHKAVYSRTIPANITSEKGLQLSLNSLYVHVPTEKEKALKVLDAMKKHAGNFGSKRLYYVFLSDAPNKDMIIYKYLMLAFKNGTKINNALSQLTVCEAFKICENVSRETEKFRQFTRFCVMEGGVQYARITPKNEILPILMPFFVNRLRIIPFVIHDLTHDLCAVYDTNKWYITTSEGISPPDFSLGEKAVQRQWKTFFNAISIKERINTELQKQNMPSRYFKDVWSVK